MSVTTEIAALHRMRATHHDGTPMSLYCWGNQLELHYCLSRESLVPSFSFDISMGSVPGELEMTVDTYSQAVPQDVWDHDEWVRAEIVLNAPANRWGVRVLSQAARALLGGRSVQLADGTMVHPFSVPEWGAA